MDKEQLKDMVESNIRFAYGLLYTDNANYLWIKPFHSTLNEKGGAGFMIANSTRNTHPYSIKINKNVRKHAFLLSIGNL